MSKMKKPSKLSLKLARRIKEEFGVEVEPIINRTYSGPIEKSRGAWSWVMYRIDEGGEV